MSLSAITSVPRSKSPVVVTWFAQQVRVILSKYFNVESKLKASYWPRHVRDFLVLTFEEICSHTDSELAAEFSNQNISRDSLFSLIALLRQSTTTCITIQKRRVIEYLLRQVHNRMHELRIKTIKPPKPLIAGNYEWPNDIMDRDDLNQCETRKHLRHDVQGYIWNFLNELLGTDISVILNYDEGMIKKDRSVDLLPIVVILEPAYCHTVTEFINNISENLRTSCDGLLPSDIISIVSDEKISFHTHVRDN